MPAITLGKDQEELTLRKSASKKEVITVGRKGKKERGIYTLEGEGSRKHP